MISAILAIAKNGVIGSEDSIPWPKIKEDMKWFVQKTTGQVVVMGKKTWISLGDLKPLKNRLNFVVTSQPLVNVLEANGTLNGYLGNGLKALEQQYKKEIIIMGGAEIYNQCFPFCEQIYLTRVKGNYDGNIKIHIGPVLEDFKCITEIQSDKCRFQIWSRVRNSEEENDR